MIDTVSVAPVTSFRDTLVRHRLLIPTGARGVYGFGAEFDRVLQRLDALITRAGENDGAEVLRFPSLLPRTVSPALPFGRFLVRNPRASGLQGMSPTPSAAQSGFISRSSSR